ncbi:hypothetical protein NAT51_15320 [Flavobacterium amniphilum]|uniref:hypothetical protein n=1 Tax=Flavobacterium amniphilum TaxID=1834035 RepID=UPI002029E3C5|nr:hypothetical protein [Flavobacterium amniphilum]MCL9806905.1 hypothetical protein [Flavobacterium amniphilum]
MEAFELRLWDGRLGRWLTVDPMGQYFSPYLGMGNNPISRIDPDGGMDGDAGDCNGCPPGWSITGQIPGDSGLYGPVEKMTFLDDVVINVVVPKAQNALEHFGAFSVGLVSAFGSNLALGANRMSPDEWNWNNSRTTFRVGQLFGDVASIFAGAFEGALGNGLMKGSIVFAPETAGISLAAVPFGAGMVAHGGAVSGVAVGHVVDDISGLYDSFSKGTHSGGDLPSIDRTGKVHGELISPKDFHKYSKEELEVLLNQLKASVQKRIKVTTKLGRDRAHGQRQGAEHDLIKSLEKYLSK